MKRAVRAFAALGLAQAMACTAPGLVRADDSKPIKIGVVHPYSGPLALAGVDASDGFELYFDQTKNRAAGRDIVLIKEDDAANPAQGLERTRRLVEREQVDLLAGMTSSAVAYAVRAYVVQHQMPLVIMGSAGANDLTDKLGSPYIFRTSFANRQLGAAFGEYACKTLGYKKVVLFASDFVTGQEQSNAFEDKYREAGCTPAGKVMVPLGTTDFAPFLSRATENGADGTWAMFFSADAVAFVKQYEALGLKAKLPLIAPAGTVDPSGLPAMGRAAIGLTAPVNYLPSLDNEANKRFVEAFRAKYGRTPGATAASGYTAAIVIAKALESLKGDVSDRKRLLEALQRVKADTPMGPFEFDDKRNVLLDFYVGTVREKDGAIALEQGPKIITAMDQFGHTRN